MNFQKRQNAMNIRKATIMKRIIVFFMVLTALFAFTSCSDDNTKGADTADLTNNVIIVVEGYGEIKVTLTPEHAPITVANFKKLVAAHAYDGTIFHRVIYDFMIQGGDTTLTPYGEADTIKGEFLTNGVKNNLAHDRGVISMAREDKPNTASSQFFICHKKSPHLDGKYAAFGYVTDGMEVVDAIASVPTSQWNDRPYEDIVITTIKFAD